MASVVSGLFLFGISFLLAAHRLTGGRSRGPESSYVSTGYRCFCWVVNLRDVWRVRSWGGGDLSSKQTELSLGLLCLNEPIHRRRLALVKDVVLGYPDTPQKRPERRGMIPPDEVRGLVDHEVLEFSTEPRISVGYVDLDDLSFLVTDAARRFEPVVPAKTHFFGPGQRRRPTHVRRVHPRASGLRPRRDVLQRAST